MVYFEITSKSHPRKGLRLAFCTSTISGGIGIGIVTGAEDLSTGIQVVTQMNQNHDSIVANASHGNLSQLSNTSTIITGLVPNPVAGCSLV